MPLLYTLYQMNREFKDGRQDPSNGKWFAKACHIGEVGTDELAERVSYATTVTKADVKAVIEGLIKEMQDAMNNSNVVVLDGIGRFKNKLLKSCTVQELLLPLHHKTKPNKNYDKESNCIPQSVNCQTDT